MRFRLIVTALLVTAGLVIGAAAQTVPKGRAKAGARITQGRAVNAAGLTDQQRGALKEIRAWFAAELKALRASNLPRQEKRAKLQALRAELTKRIGSVLTPAQQSKLKERIGKGRPGHGLKGKLGRLTPQQRQQVRAILQTARADVRAVRRDTSLTPQQKREKVQAIRRDARAKIRALLGR
jgi:Spy/CpxP family protein refolding chaperone